MKSPSCPSGFAAVKWTVILSGSGNCKQRAFHEGPAACGRGVEEGPAMC